MSTIRSVYAIHTNAHFLIQRSASLKIDWTRLQSQLGLKGTTATSLAAFKKRNDDARRKVTMLTEQPQSVDFEHYRSILSNKAIVDEIEKQVKPFKPATYDVNRQLKAIDAFEATALKSAQDTKAVVDQELRDLNKTLTNIETARPVTDLTVVCSIFIDGLSGRRRVDGVVFIIGWLSFAFILCPANLCCFKGRNCHCCTGSHPPYGADGI